MKPELIDDFFCENKTQFIVNVFDREYKTWKYAKPLNYKYGLLHRIIHAYCVLIGNAIAFRFYENFNENEKSLYIKNDIKKQSKIS